MRTVKSPTYFEPRIGRGVRIINDTDFQSVTDDAKHKDRFVVIDAVGIMDTPLIETIQPLDRRPSIALRSLMKLVGFGNKDPEVASTLAGRLARLDTRLTKDDREQLAALSGGVNVSTITHQIVAALDPDHQIAVAAAKGIKADDKTALIDVANTLLAEALQPLASNPELRNAIVDVGKSYEQTIDEVSRDTLNFAGYSQDARDKAAAMVTSFTDYLAEHRDDIRALQILYSRPYQQRLRFTEIKELAKAIERPPHRWTPEKLWRAYEMLDQSKVHGSGGRMLTDIVSLVRYALHQDDELVPFRDQVEARFAAWLTTQEQQGTTFTPEQRQWLTWMKESIAAEMGIEPESFDYTPFVEHGGIGKAVQVFGDRLTPLMAELTEALAA